MTELNLSSPSIFSDDHLIKETSSSSLSYHIILNKTNILQHDDDHHHHRVEYYHKNIYQPQDQQQADDFDLSDGSNNLEKESEGESGLKFPKWKEQVKMNTINENPSAESNNSIQVKWMSSKMRLMHKMKKSKTYTMATNDAPLEIKLDHDEHGKERDPSSYVSPIDQTANTTSASNYTTIRVCSDCHTTKTPLWRSGPCGPKSLCNACGIRQRKARRALAAATATTNGTNLLKERSSPMKISKAKYNDKCSNSSKYKKRCRIAATTSYSRKELRFEEFVMSLSKNLALHRMFPQDEREAAILLMALSCGHIHD